jgi:hypothetical protein
LQPPYSFWSWGRPKTLWAIRQLLNEAKNKEWNQNQAQHNHSLIPCFHSKIFPTNHFWEIHTRRKKAEDALEIAEKCYVIIQMKEAQWNLTRLWLYFSLFNKFAKKEMLK